ncbi:MAG: mechanosensitive ion channel [Cytophagales bacterium]|nr:mechanosensitive ion channel [Cytophagales bacterium]
MFGIYLMLSGAYKRGDLILIQDRNIEGYISKFGLKLVEIKTLDNDTIF